MSLSQSMWENIALFLVSSQQLANQVFSKLDIDLDPIVFLVGKRHDTMSGQIVVYPDGIGYSSSDFVDLDSLTPSVFSQQILARLKEISGQTRQSFISTHVKVNNQYSVSIVLQFPKSVFLKHQGFLQDIINLASKEAKFQLPASLLESCINQYLFACTKTLREKEPIFIFDDPFEIIRLAGKRFMSVPPWLCEKDGYSVNLFDHLNVISSLKYEGADACGFIALQKNNLTKSSTINFVKSIKFNEYRTVRKLIEMTSEQYVLLSDCETLFGIGNIRGKRGAETEKELIIKLAKHFTWELQYHDRILMQVSYGLPSLPKSQISEDNVKRCLKANFPDIKENRLEDLWQLARTAADQKHGTMIVVAEAAKDESIRLESQCLRIIPKKIGKEILSLMTTIDGAVLFDPEGTCHAIGVILDGKASPNGTPARGARYNSAIRYVEDSKHPCVAIVISEDGMIDLIPEETDLSQT